MPPIVFIAGTPVRSQFRSSGADLKAFGFLCLEKSTESTFSLSIALLSTILENEMHLSAFLLLRSRSKKGKRERPTSQELGSFKQTQMEQLRHQSGREALEASQRPRKALEPL